MSAVIKDLDISADSELTKHVNALIDQRFNEKLKDEVSNKLEEIDAERVPSMGIIATKGTMDMGYPPYILASTAAALGWETSIFFTFYGLELIRKDLDLKISPLGNPAMPMKMPFGPKWFKDISWNIPNTVMSNVPGFDGLATSLMKKTIKNNGTATIKELRELTLEAGAKLYACQMTVDLFGMEHDDFIPEVEDWIGATSYLNMSQKNDICLFV